METTTEPELTEEISRLRDKLAPLYKARRGMPLPQQHNHLGPSGKKVFWAWCQYCGENKVLCSPDPKDQTLTVRPPCSQCRSYR